MATDARHPPADPPSEESDRDSDATGAKELSPRYAQPVPVGAAEPLEAEAEAATEDEDTVEEPTYTFAQGYGRFVFRYTRSATALGNFEQGNVQAESAVVAHWLTSGLGIAMSRVGWNLLSLDIQLLDFPVKHSPIITILVSRRRPPVSPIWLLHLYG